MKNIALFIKSDKDSALKCVADAVGILTDLGCTLYVDSANEYLGLKSNNIHYVPEDNLYDNAECVVVFGGDGTIMRAAHSTILPIIAVNLGRIGYLAELETDEVHLLKKIVDDDYTLDNRMMFKCLVQRDGKKVFESSNILNDIVLTKGGYSEMPEVELFCDNEEVGRFIADGLICATPTGSTAYSLSAGGPIVAPNLELFCVSHICPQSFYAKPLVFDGRSVLVLKKGVRAHGRIHLVADGKIVSEIIDGDEIIVSKGEKVTKFISVKQKNRYSVMRSKMTEI